MLIFNFHHVEPAPLHADRKHITITPNGLRNFIRSLRALGKTPVALREVIASGGPDAASHKQVLLTFDDGYRNFLEYAVPVLEEERCPGTVFVLPGRPAGTNEWDQGDLPEEQRDRLMSLEEMKALARCPYVDIGSHGLMHRDFSQLDTDTLREEVHGSYELLQQALGPAFVPALAYPWGRYGPTALDVLKDSPYRYAFTTEKGRWLPESPRFEVPRYSIYYRDGNPLVFLAKLCRNGLLFTR